MRKFLSFFAICLMVSSMFAAPPQAFRYQAIVRDLNGEVVANRDNIRVQVIIQQGSIEVYREEHAVRSNDLGMIHLRIGEPNAGIPPSGQFDQIDWGADRHFIQLRINVPNEAGTLTGWANLQRAELLSVPYALFAANAGGLDLNLTNRVIPFYDATQENLVDSRLSQIGDTIVISGGGTLRIGNYIFPAETGTPGQTLVLSTTADSLIWADGGGGGGDYWVSGGAGNNHLRNTTPGNVVVGSPTAFPARTNARLLVNDGDIGIGGTFAIASPPAHNFSFTLGHGNILGGTTTEETFLLGSRNVAAGTPHVSILGAGNQFLEPVPTNHMGVLIGTYNTTTAADNILIGRSNESTHANVIAFGTDLRPSQNSIFIGSGIQEDRDHSNTNNIVMGHNIEMNDVRSAISNSILIGNNLNDWDILLDGSEGLSANRTIAIGNDINPHNRGVRLSAGHYTINIGNRISTSSQRSINIGQDIRSDFDGILATDQNPTIAIGRNITFPTNYVYISGTSPSGSIQRNFIDHEGTIVLGTNFPGLYPGVLGRTDDLLMVGFNGNLRASPRPRFVVGGYSTFANVITPYSFIPQQPRTPIHFLYIDDFANAYFGFTGAAMTDIISSAPFELFAGGGTGNPASGQASGGTIFARQFVGLSNPATISDRELKTNIRPIGERLRSDDAPRFAPRSAVPSAESRFTRTLFSEALHGIRVYAYNYDFAAADQREQIGFMAQNILPYFPHLVQTHGDIYMVVQSGLIPILWSISQDQQTQIEELQDEVSTLRDELAEIRYLLNQLKNRND